MGGEPIRIWDTPVRIVHWLLAVLVPSMWLTAQNKLWDVHKSVGVAIILLVVFRIVWGFVGTDTARFASFVKGPRAVLAYLRGERKQAIGHSPLGALSVLALFAAILTQATLGLFSGDPFDGPTGALNHLVGARTAQTLTEWHEVFWYVVYGLVALHLGAIAYYTLVRRQVLIRAMITGKGITGTGDGEAGQEGNSKASWGRGLFALAIAMGVVAAIIANAPA